MVVDLHHKDGENERGRVMTNSTREREEELRHRQLNFDNIKPTFSFDMSTNPTRAAASWRLV